MFNSAFIYNLFSLSFTEHISYIFMYPYIYQTSEEDTLFGRAHKHITEYRNILSAAKAMGEIRRGEWVYGNFEYPLRWTVHTAFKMVIYG